MYVHPFQDFVNPYLGDLLRGLRLDKRYVKGAGSVLTDDSGRNYLDFVAGYGAVPFGHNHPEIWAAALGQQQRGEPCFTQPSLLDAAGELAERLLQPAPAGLRYVCFANSGAEAVEAALKACRAATGRSNIIAARNSFHGKTLGALSATGNFEYQKDFCAPVPGFAFVPYGDADSLQAALGSGDQDTAAVILEPIQGEGGVNVPPPGYLRAVRALCDRYGALLILDEVQTGLGRTGSLFACAAAGVLPDCLTLAKALGGGLVPIGACLMSDAAFSEAFALKHSSTFAGNALACRVGLAALDLLTRDKGALLNQVNARSDQLRAGLCALVARYPGVLSEVRGEGLLLGLEFAVERRTFPEAWGTYLGILGEQGNLLPVVAGYLLNVEGMRTAPTLNGNHVLRIEPPLTVTAAECHAFLEAIARTVALLAQGHTSALLRHLVDETAPLLAPAAPPKSRSRSRQATPTGSPGEGRFAFLVHPIDDQSFVEFDQSLRGYRPESLAWLGELMCRHIKPFVMASTHIRSSTGATAYGEFIAVPRSAKQLMAMVPGEALRLVRQALELARQRGAQIVGLGGYTSIVTRGGTQVAHEGVAVTTGNGFTVISAMEAVELAAHRLGLSLDRLHVAVVGAGGLIGSVAVRMLMPKVGHLTLVGNPANPSKTRRRFAKVVHQGLASLGDGRDEGEFARAVRRHLRFPVAGGDAAAWDRLAEELLEENGARAPLCWSTDVARALLPCHIVVTATSSTEPLVQPEFLRPGAVVCDLSRPSNVSRAIVETRPDVLVIDGGVVEMPGRPDLGWNFGFPRGVGYACMAETMMLALEQHFQNTSVGIDLSPDNQQLVAQLAQRHGFRLSGLRSFDRVLTAVDWRWLLQERSGDRRPPAEVSVARQSSASLDGTEPVNVNHYLLDRHIECGRGAHTALIEEDRRVSYDDLYALVQKGAALLRRHGVGVGERVAFISYDTVEAVAFLLATTRLGGVAVYLNSFLSPQEYPYFVQHAQPRIVLLSCHFEATVGPVLDGLRQRWHTMEAAMATATVPARALPPTPVPAASPAICLYSSGSTGQPKAALHSHRDIVNTNLNYVASVLEIGPDDVTFSLSKLFFAYGFNSVHYALFAGGTAVLAPRRNDPQQIYALIQRSRPTVMFAVSTLYLLLLRQDGTFDLSSLRCCVSAGETLPEDVFDAWRTRFGLNLLDGIGTTEVLSTFISNRPDDLRPGSTGKVVPGFEVRLLDANGRPSADGEIGILWVRGNTVTSGYWRDPVTTADCFRDGWFCTHDMFYRDARGWFYYVGRANDMLKVGGCWVSPLAIEQVIREHPAVAECGVVAKPELGLLVRPQAFVVLKDGVEPGPNLAEALKAHARGRLAPQQYPHFVEFIDRLPKTATGKVQRYQLRISQQIASRRTCHEKS